MKKLFALLLAAALVLSAAFVFTACGDTKEAETTDSAAADDTVETSAVSEAAETTEDTTAAEGTDSVFPASLSDVASYPIPDLAYTTWTLSGGMADGKEMEAADVENLLEKVGGTLDFMFLGNNEVYLDRADKTLEGTYTLLLDDYAMDIDLGDLGYYAVMTDVEGTAVLVVSPKATPEIALYLTQIEEG